LIKTCPKKAVLIIYFIHGVKFAELLGFANAIELAV
jgi:hypothetical protein